MHRCSSSASPATNCSSFGHDGRNGRRTPGFASWTRAAGKRPRRGSQPARETMLAAIAGGARLDENLRRRVSEAADGTPLFVEEMMAILPEHEDATAVPPTILAVLAARLDALGVDERAVAGAASVVGQEF